MGISVHTAQADQWDKKTILTVNQSIQVKERLLPPGTYVLKLMDSASDRHIVQIFNNDQSRIIDTVLAIPNYRLQPTGHSQFAFWETPPGNAKALRAWFYPGDNFGQEFPYPKHFIQLEASAATSYVTTMPAAPVTEEAAPVTQPTEPQQETQKEVEVEQNEEIAQATPPQTTPVPPPTTTPLPEPSANREAPEMPKTGSFYPLIGLCGLFSLGVYGLFRLKRTA